MDLQLEGKVAIVTGAGNGIGRGIAAGLAAEGAIVAAVDLDESRAAGVVREIEAAGGRGLALEVDAADETAVEQMIGKCRNLFGRIDILVNNVGGGSGLGPVVKLSTEVWDQTIEINLRSAFLCSAAAARAMIPQRSGRIISISSISGKLGESLIGPYCAAKFGVIGLMQVMAKELARYGITVNTVCPGYVWTPGWKALAEAMRAEFAALAGLTPEQIFDARIKSAVPLGRPQTPEDIAALVAFLSSDRARNITGQAINVDGGAVMA
jgi:meso-butanediol dehydrogenase / (S,S)-butanediol dehydrogenase / diacetyl reductase